MQTKKIIAPLVLGLIGILAFTYLGKEIVLEPRNYKSDFFWIWYGSRAVIHHQNPYSLEATRAIQIFLSGNTFDSGQYSHPFPFPAYLAAVFSPMALLPYRTALLLWTGIQFPLLFTALYLMKIFLDLEIQGAKLGLYLFAGSISFCIRFSLTRSVN